VSRRDAAPATSMLGAHAGLVSRLLALLIDIALLMLTLLVGNLLWSSLLVAGPVRWLTAALVGWAPGLEPWRAALGLILPPTLGALTVVGYFLFFLTLGGQTVGKRIIGLRVVSTDGRRISTLQALVRVAGYLVSSAPLYIGFLAALFDSERRAWHDRLAGTVVVYAWEARPDERFLARQRSASAPAPAARRTDPPPDRGRH